MRIPAVAALSLVVVLGACGGDGGDDSAKPTPTKTTAATKVTTSAGPSPQVSAGAGKPAPQDLESFRCARDAKGRWNATAVVSNSTKKAQDYQITVHVGAPEVEASPARTQTVGRVNAGGSVTVRVLKIPAQSAEGPCQVQLLATPA